MSGGANMLHGAIARLHNAITVAAFSIFLENFEN